MFEILPGPSLETILIVSRAALLIGAFWVFALAFIRWRRADERNAQRLQGQLQQAFAEVRGLHEAITVMSARLEAMSESAESRSRLTPAGLVSSQRGYDLAMRLAKNGASVEEIVASCGMTRHEAELLTRLHGAKRCEIAASQTQPARVAQPAAPWPAQNAPAATPASRPAPARKRSSLLSVVG